MGTMPPTAAPSWNTLGGENNSWSYVGRVTDLYLVIAAVFLVLFEMCRHSHPYVYETRRRENLRRDAVRAKKLYSPAYGRPLGWIYSTVRASDDDLIRLHGLDAYACVRFLKLNVVIALFCVASSCGVLLPIYDAASRASGKYAMDTDLYDDAMRQRVEFVELTLFAGRRRPGAGAALDSTPRRACIWFSCMAAYALAGFVYVVVRREYRAHRDRRCEWLLHGDPDWARQALYTVVVEHLPPALRTPAALRDHFEHLFPGAVAATTLVLMPPQPQSKCAKAAAVATRSALHRPADWAHAAAAAVRAATPDWRARSSSPTREAREIISNPLLQGAYENADSEFIGSDDGLDDTEYDDEVALAPAPQASLASLAAHAEGSPRPADAPRVYGHVHGAPAARRGGSSSRLPLICEELWLLAIGRRQESTAFITFSSLATATCAARVELSHRAFTMLARPAPEPNDVVWRHARTSLRQRTLRQWIGGVAVAMGGVAWCSFLSYIDVLFQSPAMVARCGRALHGLFGSASDDDGSTGAAAEYGALYIASAISLVSLILVPWLAALLAWQYEKPLTRTDVELSVFRRYTLFQFLYVYASIVSLSVQRMSRFLVQSPREALAVVALQISQASGHFVSVLVIKTCFGLMWELSRAWPLLSKWGARKLFPGGDAYHAAGEADRPRYGWMLPNVVVVSCILLTFTVITPLLTPFALAYFVAAYVVYKHQLLYVYAPPSQMCGAFSPLLLQALLNALTGSQIVLVGFYLSSSEWLAASAAAPLAVCTQLVAFSLRSAYDRALRTVPLNIARHIDRREPPPFTNELYSAPPDEPDAPLQPTSPSTPPRANDRGGYVSVGEDHDAENGGHVEIGHVESTSAEGGRMTLFEGAAATRPGSPTGPQDEAARPRRASFQDPASLSIEVRGMKRQASTELVPSPLHANLSATS
ncbi:hypothetical protein M885DRAFT_463837 [Pelagophyceae sp. CCMP2097]|nr:hypothetical protein M885DRAFT_463837 [Pelagophyceae sp. CCMP2097]